VTLFVTSLKVVSSVTLLGVARFVTSLKMASFVSLLGVLLANFVAAFAREN
jgi:hypothetical protein